METNTRGEWMIGVDKIVVWGCIFWFVCVGGKGVRVFGFGWVGWDGGEGGRGKEESAKEEKTS